MYRNVLQVFHDVLRCLVSHAMIGIDNAAGIGDNSAGFDDNSVEIGDDAARIAAKVIPCQTPS